MYGQWTSQLTLLKEITALHRWSGEGNTSNTANHIPIALKIFNRIKLMLYVWERAARRRFKKKQIDKPMNILYLSYASEPGKGSEYGVGWNVPLAYARCYPADEVYVLTRGRVRAKIEAELASLNLHNLHYLFYDIPKWLTYPNEMQSHWGEQINYLLWQLMARKTVKQTIKEKDIDIVHHLTFNQYRTPSPGFWTKVPFVMGPIGGAETIAPCFDQDLTPHTLRKERVRREGKDLPLFGWFTKRNKNKKVILFSSQENERRIMPYCSPSCKGMVMPAIAFSPDDFKTSEDRGSGEDECFEMIYAGKALDWKGLHIFLKAVKKAFADNGITNIRARLIGIRFEEERKTVTEWVNQLGLGRVVELIPFMERGELLSQLADCNLSVYPAFRDSGSMSVLEASALACPTICFDAGGQDAFPDDVLFKVAVKATYEDTLNAFAEKLLWVYRHTQDAKAVGQKAKEYVGLHLTWERRVADFHDIYEKLLKK